MKKLQVKLPEIKFSRRRMRTLSFKSLLRRINWKTYVALGVILILSPIVYFQFLKPSNTQAAWWNGDYKYRKAITFTNSSSAISSERKIKFDVDTATLITAGKMQSDCDDVRFTDSRGQLLDYFIDTNTADCNTSSTDFYLKFPSIAAGEQQVYMYYGNASVTRNEPGGRKNDFFDPNNTSAGMKGYWKLNESAANTCPNGTSDTCSSALTVDGDWVNSPTPATGKFNNGLQFDNSTNSVSFGTSVLGPMLDGAAQVSISAWTYSTANPPVSVTNNDAILLSIVGNGTQHGSALIFENSTGTPRLECSARSAPGEAKESLFANHPGLNQWVHTVCVIDYTNDMLYLYINGALANSSSVTFSNTTYTHGTPTGRVDGITEGNNVFGGTIDDVKIFKRGLSASDATSLYNGGAGYEIPTPLSYTPDSGPTLASEETTPGPVAYWKFDEGQGQAVNDQTTHNNDGTLGANSSSASDDPTWIEEGRCVSGKCLQFDGSNDYIATSEGSGFSINQFSYSAWIRPDDVADVFIVDNRDGQSDGVRVRVTDNKFNCSYNATDSTGTTDLIASRWYHVACISTGSALNVYVNGILEKSTAITGSISESTNFNIGRNGNNGTKYFNGIMDEIKVYPYARSAAEIKADYSAGASVLGLSDQKDYLSEGLVGYWPMDELSANTCSGGTNDNCDKSGNSNNGAWTGDATTTTASKFGNAVTFDDNGDYISVADSSTLDNTNKITLAGWINPSTVSGSDTIMHKELAYQLMLSAGTLNVALSPQWAFQTGPSFSANEWAHFAIVWDGKEIRMYKNGVLTTTTDITDGAISNTAFALNIGDHSSSPGSAYAFNGKIDDIRIYNRDLSADDVRNLYNWAPAPIGYWNFDDATTGQTVTDITTNANSATLGTNSSVASDDPAWVPGKYGGGLYFDGSDDFVNVGDPSSGIFDMGTTNSFTMEAWIKTTDATAADKMVANFAGDCTAVELGFGLSSTGVVRARARDSNNSPGSSYVATGTTAVNDGNWHHIVAVRDTYSDVWRVYVDGRLEDSQTDSTTGNFTIASNKIYFGKRPSCGSSEFYKGALDDMKFYNYARTAAQIKEDMNAFHPLGGSPVGSQLAYWSFDEQQGQTVNNRITTSSNGTLGANSSSASDDPTWKTKVDCKINGCLSFDGSNDIVNIGDQADIGTGEYTVSAWIKTSDTDAEIVSKGNGSDFSYDLRIWSDQLDFMLFTAAGSTYCNASQASTAVNDNTWHYIAGTWIPGVSCNLYIDGKLIATDTTFSGTFNNNSAASLRIGGRVDGAAPTSGSIDEVKIYNSALTSDQIKADMNAGSSVSYSVLGSSEAADMTDGAGNAPIAEWDFEDATTSQTLVDTAGGTYTATRGTDSSSGSDDPTWESAAKCKSGKCLSYDGVDDFTEVPHASALNAYPITLQGWIKTTSSASYVGFLNKYGSGDQNGWNLFMLSGNIRAFYFRSAGNSVWGGGDGLNGGAVNDGKWHLITFTVDSTGGKLYVDGVLKDSLAWSGTAGAPTTTRDVNFGNYPGSFLPGMIDDVRIYDYARTASQIAYDYNRGAPIVHYKMDECQGGTINDSSGQAAPLSGTITIGASGSQTSVGTCSTSSTAWGTGSSGKYSSSLNFDGNDDYVTVSDTDKLSFTSGGMSGSAWINMSGSNSFPVIMSKDLGGGREYVAYFESFFAGGPLRVIVFDSTTGGHISRYASSFKIANATNSWNHFMFTYDGSGSASGIKIYINGKQVDDTDASSGSFTTMRNGTSDFLIGTGTSSSSTFRFPGKIDDVRLYNYALSATQVKKVMNENSTARYGN